MSDKAKDDAIKTREQESELSEEALAEASGGGIIVVERQGSTQLELDTQISEISMPALDGSSSDAGEGGYTSKIRATRDAEKGM